MTFNDLQIINTFSDSVMSVCLTKTEIIAGSVDGTVRTFDIRIGRYELDYLHAKHAFATVLVPLLLKWLFLNKNYMFLREISDNFGQPVNCISLSNDGNCILASCLDSSLRLLDR